jgi:hypothetical protein
VEANGAPTRRGQDTDAFAGPGEAFRCELDAFRVRGAADPSWRGLEGVGLHFQSTNHGSLPCGNRSGKRRHSACLSLVLIFSLAVAVGKRGAS